MKLWHAGVSVKDLDQAIVLWESLGFVVKQKFEKDDPAALAALMEDAQGTGIELWQFTGDSPLKEFVGRHIAFKVENARETADKMIAQGFKEIIPFTQGVMVNYIFVADEFGVNYELAEVKEGEWEDE